MSLLTEGENRRIPVGRGGGPLQKLALACLLRPAFKALLRG